MANEVRILSTLKDNVTGQLGRMQDKFDTLGKSKGFQSIVTGVGLGIGQQVWNQAVGSMVGVIGDMIEAAKEDQVSVQKLGSALRENVKNWDGNTEAIERVLKARMKLGFSDDEQRASLATIVRTTHDVNKALFLEAGAMDIARARNVDLATASDAVAKASAGNSKALKSLIPGLQLGATSAETLSNAFKAVKGSAEDYAKTDAGKVLVAQVKVNEAMETFGYKILPGATDAMVSAADAVTGLATTLDFLSKGSAKTLDGQQEQVQAAIDLTQALGILNPALAGIAGAEQDMLDKSVAASSAMATVTNESDRMGDAGRLNAKKIGSAFGEMGADAVDFRDKYKDAAGEVSRASHRMTTQLVKDAARIRGEVFDETEIRADLHATRMELHDAEVARSHAKTKEAMRQASDDIVQSLDDEGQGLEDLADQGKLTKKDVDRFAADVKKNYALLSKDGRHQIDLLLERYRLLANQKNINKTFTLNYKTKGTPSGTGTGTHAGGSGPQEFAKGGVVKGPLGSPQEAIVHAGETVRTPEQERALHRSSVGAAGAVMAGSGITVIVNAGIGTSFTAAEGRRLADAILPPLVAAMQRTGQLPRTGTGLRG